MKKLFDLGIEIDKIIEIIPDILNFEIDENIEVLKKINCNDLQIKNIITANPYFLIKDISSVNKLINKLKNLGITNLNITFDSNPFLFDFEDYEIDNFITNKLKIGMKKEEIIDLIDIGNLD